MSVCVIQRVEIEGVEIEGSYGIEYVYLYRRNAKLYWGSDPKIKILAEFLMGQVRLILI